MNLTYETVNDLIRYDPDTGVVTWKRRDHGAHMHSFNYMRAGKPAGSLSQWGYIKIKLRGRMYLAHRLGWLLTTGSWPASMLDHIDGNGLNNRFNNLRLATACQNRANSKVSVTNTSGAKGVSWNSQRRKWHAQICCEGRILYLGCFDELEMAANAYQDAAIKHFGEFRRAAP